MEFYQKIKNRFPYLDDEKLAEMLSLGELVTLKEGEVFIEAGSRTHQVGIVVEGLMRNYIINDNGEQVTVVFATEMQAITPYATIFLNKPASETTEAIEPSVLYVFDYEKLKSRIDTDPAYARIYANLVENTLVSAIERIEDFTKKKPEQRYQRLMEIHGNLIDRVPLKYLASYLGITPVSLSRIRKRLAKNRN
jgi:CRP-like cAMP-binding protein